MGTPDFLAPEQSQNAHDADIRADIYSLGCTLCFLLTGRPPFPGTTAVDKVRAHAEREAIPVESLRPDLPANLAAAIRRMMARNRAGRFADPASAAAALESFDRRSDVRASTSAHRVPPGNRSWTRVALTMLAVALVAAGVIYIRLGETTLRVEINDPALAVKLDNARLTIDDRGRTVKIVPGDRHALKIEQNGLEVESDSFVLKKGEQVVLRAAVVNGRPEVAIEGASEALDRKRHHPDVPLASPVELPLAATFEGHKSYVDGIAFSPDGTWLASGSEDGTVRFWDLRTRTAGLMLTIDAQVTALAFSPEGKILAVGTGPGTVTLWNIETGRPVAALTGKLNKIHSLAFSPDGRMLASADLGGAIHLWDVATLESNRTLHQSQVPIESVAFSANGQRLAAGDYEGMIRIWDTNAWKLLQQIEGAAHDVAISANGKRIATGSRVFNAENGDVVWRFERAVPASDVAFTADGRHVVTCCYGNQLLVWNAATGNLVATASTEKRGIHELGISPDGRFVAAGGGFEYKDRVIPDGDNAVRLWALPQSVWPATK
jgi:WD40 repeat protein